MDVRAAIPSLPANTLLTRNQLVELSGLSLPTLKRYAALGKGPKITRVEGLPRFRADDVRAWLNIAFDPVGEIDSWSPPPKVDRSEWNVKSVKLTPSAWGVFDHADAIPFDKVLPVRVSIRALRVSGVYFLCGGRRVFYVGQSVNVLSRLTSHVSTYGGQITSIYTLKTPIDQLDAYEGFYIRLLMPEKNTSGPFSDLWSVNESKNRTFAGKMRNDQARWRHIPM